jgi:hypothetical protein
MCLPPTRLVEQAENVAWSITADPCMAATLRQKLLMLSSSKTPDVVTDTQMQAPPLLKSQ